MSIISKHHECPWRALPHENLAYVVYRNGHWCFSCNKGDLRDESYFSYKPSTTKLSIDKDLILPSAIRSHRELPIALKAWLYGYYMFTPLLDKYNIKYCPYNYFKSSKGQIFEGESLLFPIIIDNEIVAYLQRFFPDKKFYSCKTKDYIIECGNNDSNTVVLVEDYISAMRVGEVENCLWLQGTGLTKKLETYIINNYSNIYIWLDGDKPGQENANKIFNKLEKSINKLTNWGAFSIQESRIIRNIVTENDPKCHSNSEIRGILA